MIKMGVQCIKRQNSKQKDVMKSLKTLCATTLILSLALLALGPLIQFDQSQTLVCQDWPLCFGEILPQQIEGRGWLEYTHRFLAAVTGFLSLLMALIAFNKRRDPQLISALKPIAMSLFFIVIQGALGAITVIYKLPTVVSTAHMFFSLVYILYLGKIWIELSGTGPLESSVLKNIWNPNHRDALFLSLFSLFVLLILSSLVRHTGSLRVCGTGIEAILACQPSNALLPFFHTQSPQINLHLSYRLLSLISAVLAVISLARFAFYARKFSASLARTAFIALFFQVQLFFTGPILILTHLPRSLSVLYVLLSFLATLSLWFVYLKVKKIEIDQLGGKQHTFFSDLIELTKPRLSGLVVVTTLVGILMAPSSLSLFKSIWALTLITMVVMGACALNCYIEKDVDVQMERTKTRSLPSGRMKPSTALIFGVGLLLVSLPLLALTINYLTAALGLSAAVLYLYAYTPMKRMSETALYVGAIPGALPPLMGWTTVMNEMSPLGLSLFFILFVWQLPHFLAISIFHAQDYEGAGIKVYPNQKGINVTKWGIVGWTAVLFFVSIVPSYWGSLGSAYQISALIFGAAFLLLALMGLFTENNDKEQLRLWARRYFLGSIFYLPLLLGAMIFFR